MQHFFKIFSQHAHGNFLNFAPLLVECGCLFVKVLVLSFLFRSVRSLRKNKAVYHLIIILSTGIFTNISLLILRLSSTPFELFSSSFFGVICRIECATSTLQFYIFLCFFRELSSIKLKNLFLQLFAKVTFLATFGWIVFFMGWSVHTFFSGDVSSGLVMRKLVAWNEVFVLFELLIVLAIAFRNHWIEPINLLRHHIFVLGTYFMVPYLIVKIQESRFVAPALQIAGTIIPVNFPATMITSIWLTAMIYYCARRLFGLRFLNVSSHVQSKPSEKLVL